MIEQSKPHLCGCCKQINFNALLPPTTTQLDTLRRGEYDNGRPWLLASVKDGESAEKIVLGSLNDIEARSPSCDLCALFTSIITSSGAGRSADAHLLRRDNLIFRADPDLSYYGRIFAQGEDGTHGFVLRRLSLTGHLVDTVSDAYEPGAFGQTEVYFDHVLQPSIPGQLIRRTDTAELTFGARKRQSNLDIPLIKKWMSLCSDEHGPSCPAGSEYHMNVFRVIDVQQNCIRVFRDIDISTLQYVTLSYVWGGPQALMLLKKNAMGLQEPHALNADMLPGTIRDSMELVRLLDLRYLWVDALCIVQDSPEDKVEQISSMADIYTTAYLTIVAATGINADAGLPGVRRSRRKRAQHEVVVSPPSVEGPGLSLVNCLKEYPSTYGEWYARGMESADFNKWSTRGWCLQEGFLSVRRLTFTEEQLFWTCGWAYFCEESCFEVAGLRLTHFFPSVHKVSLLSSVSNADPWQTFSDLVDNYTRRDLTFDGDAANAFGAVFKTFERQTNASFLWGLPRPFFELGLMWESNHGVTRRDTSMSLAGAGPDHRFPSWSWLGWKGQSSCKVTSERLETERPSVACFVLESADQPLLQHVAAAQQQTSKVLTASEIDERSVTLDEVEGCFGTSTSQLLNNWPAQYLLFFWTTVVHLQIRLVTTQDPKTFAEYAASSFPKILDAQGNEAGSLCRTRAGTPPQADGSCQAEFIEVGRRRDPELPEEIVPPRVLVLQIKRDETGVAHRVNYGEVDMLAWEAAKPQSNLIILA